MESLDQHYTFHNDRLYNEGLIHTIKNIRNRYDCGLLAAKYLCDTYRDVFGVDFRSWYHVDPQHFEDFFGIFYADLMRKYDSREYQLSLIRDKLHDFNATHGTNYIIVRDYPER